VPLIPRNPKERAGARAGHLGLAASGWVACRVGRCYAAYRFLRAPGVFEWNAGGRFETQAMNLDSRGCKRRASTV